MIGEIRQNFTEASASVGLILATALGSEQRQACRKVFPTRMISNLFFVVCLKSVYILKQTEPLRNVERLHE